MVVERNSDQNKSTENRLNEMGQWMADNERLVIAGLQKIGPGPFDNDEAILDSVKQRCINKFGEHFGLWYYQGLIETFPWRHKELFPEMFGENGEDLSEIISP